LLSLSEESNKAKIKKPPIQIKKGGLAGSKLRVVERTGRLDVEKGSLKKSFGLTFGWNEITKTYYCFFDCFQD
jgi:hypothetical protein